MPFWRRSWRYMERERQADAHRNKLKLAGINLRIWKRALCLIQVSISFPPPCRVEELSSPNLEFSDAPPPLLLPSLSSLYFHLLSFILSCFSSHFYIFSLLFSTLYFISEFSSSGSLVTLLRRPFHPICLFLYLLLALQRCELLLK